MRASTRSSFFGFTIGFEGKVSFMYLDILGLVTTAIGILCDSKPAVRTMPWFRQDGTPATQSDIDADWDRVKARQDMKMRGGMAFASVAQLRLHDDGIEQVVLAKLDVMEGELKKQYTDWESWPADAQLATLSMSWACGPWFGNSFKTLKTALLAQDWAGAAANCHMNTNGPDGVPGTSDDNRGLIPRNTANVVLYKNADAVQKTSLDGDTLFYPQALAGDPGNAYDPSTVTGYQKALAVLGYDVGNADGVAGTQTVTAVKQFQTDQGLTADGVVGPATQQAILAALQKRKD